MTKTIMLIHGAWLNGASWEGFKARYEAKGYTVVAPSWPLDERPPAELRASPHPDLHKIGFKEIVNHYDGLIHALPERPFIIGHSVGGTFTQLLLDRGLGVAGVAIHPAPTSGVLVGWQTIVSTFPVFLSWGSWGRVMHMTEKFFATRFAQTERDPKTAYDKYVVPTPGKVYWSGLAGKASKIRWNNPNRAPLLLIGGDKDLIAESGMTKSIYEKQKQASSTTELKTIPAVRTGPAWIRAGSRSRMMRSRGASGRSRLRVRCAPPNSLTVSRGGFRCAQPTL